MTTAEKLAALCVTMKAVHKWEPMIEMWVDEHGVHMLRMQHIQHGDIDSSPLRTFLQLDNMIHLPEADFVDNFVRDCTEGLE